MADRPVNPPGQGKEFITGNGRENRLVQLKPGKLVIQGQQPVAEGGAAARITDYIERCPHSLIFEIRVKNMIQQPHAADKQPQEKKRHQKDNDQERMPW